MPQKYNQLKAMFAVTKASLKATFRSPQSIFFSLFFPIVLIWIFGSLSGNSVPTGDVSMDHNSDTQNVLAYKIMKNPVLHFVSNNNNVEDQLKKGKITA